MSAIRAGRPVTPMMHIVRGVSILSRMEGPRMHLAFRSARPQLSLRALLMLGAATLMVIVGLLAMHTFTADPAGHGAPGLSHSASAAGGDHLTATVGADSAGISCDGPCHTMTGPAQSDHDMLTACVLALLAGLLLLLPPALGRGRGVNLQRFMSRVRWNTSGVLPRAPSLTFLSIRRT